MTHNILVVDDDPDAREILNWILQALEIPIREAKNGQEALNMMLADLPSLVVMDLTMPELDGEAVLAAMRAEPSLVNVPVIVFTAAITTPELLVRLGLPPAQVQRKGSQSMTELRNIIVDLLGAEVKVELD